MPFNSTFDPYKILHLQPTAALADVKKSYRKLACKFHPDKVDPKDIHRATEKFLELQKAYDFLLNKHLKVNYDKIALQKVYRRKAKVVKKAQRSKARQKFIDDLEKCEISLSSKNSYGIDATKLAEMRRQNKEACSNLVIQGTVVGGDKTLNGSLRKNQLGSFDLDKVENDILNDLLQFD